MCKKVICLIPFVLLLGLAANVSADLLSDPSLIIYYSFDQFDKVVPDQSGKGHDGVVNGSVTPDAEGVRNGAAKFAKGSYLDLNGPSFPAEDIPTSEITLAAWVKCENTGDHHAIFNARAADATWVVHPELRSEGNFRWLLRSAGGNTMFDIRAGTVTWDEWLHFAGTYDKAAGKAILYINGEVVYEQTVANPLDIVGDWGMGARVGYNIDNARPFTGLMDIFCLFKRALSQDEIKKAMQGEAYPYALNPNPPDGSYHPDTWASLSWTPGDFAVSHDVYFSDNFDDVNNGTGGTFRANQATTYFVVGFPGYPYPDGLVPGTTYYWRIDEVNDADSKSPWKGPVWRFTVPPKTAYNPDPPDGAESVDPNVMLSWTPGFGAKLHTTYIGESFDDVNNATGGLAQGTTTYDPGPLKVEKLYYWRVDEFDGSATYKGNIWSFTTPGTVGNPKPANGAVDVKQTQILSWKPADHAASHQVYFGTDKEAVRSADMTSPQYKGDKPLGSESFDPGKLAWQTTYYWRVDEVNNLNPDSSWKGPLWSFTTADFIVVDDFEDYDVGNNEIWWAWKDGLGYAAHDTEPAYPGNGTGSAVGDETTPSYTEEKIVHGGGQSMPFSYDNNKQGYANYSQVERTLSYPRDWTEHGVNALVLWFRGRSSNSAERLYVAIANGTGAPAVVYHDDAAATQKATWTKWVIPLSAFADEGIDLTDVEKIAIGIGTQGNMTTPGGSGKMYFDDIALY
jgi:Concanavalin A-like lectin/glucanases superfamily